MTRLDVIRLLYIVAFSLFIYGLMGLTGPRTAVRGNRIAAVGMTIAVVATLLIPGMGNWGLIVVGAALIIGANDVTNPDARTKADSPIYGMPTSRRASSCSSAP